MHYEHEASIREEDIATRTDVHAALAEGLAFPAHYGANLNALEDSLGDVSSPSIVRVLRSREEDEELPFAEYLDRVCTILMRAARENPALEVEISFAEPARGWDEAY